VNDTTVVPVTTYNYVIRARDAAGNVSGPSQVATVTTPDSIPPTTPSNFVANAVGPIQVNLSWRAATDNVGVTGYELYRDSRKIATLAKVTSYIDRSVLPATTYSYAVRAFDAAHNFSDTSTAAATTPPDLQPPTRPTNFVAIASSATSVELTWSLSTDNVAVTAYHIYRDSVLIASIGPSASFTDESVLPLTTYSYLVRAADGSGNTSAPSNVASASTPADTQPPTAPKRLEGDALSTTEINLRWEGSSDNVGVTGYQIYRDNLLLATIGVAIGYSDTTCSPNTEYSYYLTARDGAGNVSAASGTIRKKTPSH
jgi:chitodextrinase